MIQIASKKDEAQAQDPTVSSESSAKESPGAHPAVPVEQGSDWAGDKQYAENPDKPDESTIAQVEIRPDEQ